MRSEKEIREKLENVKVKPRWYVGWVQALEWVLEDSEK